MGQPELDSFENPAPLPCFTGDEIRRVPGLQRGFQSIGSKLAGGSRSCAWDSQPSSLMPDSSLPDTWVAVINVEMFQNNHCQSASVTT